MAIVVPGYVLGHVLGQGKQSVVHEATEVEFGTPVAIKTLTTSAPRSVRLMKRELQVGVSLRHPNLVRVLGGNVTSPPYHIVMDMLPGESLRDRLDRRRRLSIDEAISVTRQVAAGLTALHAVGYIHSDVKPENIRLVRHGGVKLVDLGFAHRPGEDDDLHAAGSVLGTANYLAPELCRRPVADGFAADVFALGVTMFEALSGSLPYADGTTEEVVRRHRRDPPRELRDYGSYPPAVARTVRRMLASIPADRPSARVLASELGDLQISQLGRAA